MHLTAESDVFHPFSICQYSLQNLGMFLQIDGVFRFLLKLFQISFCAL